MLVEKTSYAQVALGLKKFGLKKSKLSRNDETTYRAFADKRGWLILSLSRCISWPKLSLYYSEINNIMYAVKTLYLDIRLSDVKNLGRFTLEHRNRKYKTS